MKYIDYIQQIIATRGQWQIPEGEYWEGHHIVPKCLGGKGSTRSKHPNIIRLYPQEHYEAHRLLALENPDILALQRAWFATSHAKTQGVIIKINADEYAALKRLIAEKHIPWNKGKHNIYSEETLKKMGVQNVGRIPWNKGITWDANIRAKISQKRAEQAQEFGEPHLGKKHSPETKKFLSQYFTNTPPHSCQIIDLSTNIIYKSKAQCIKELKISMRQLNKGLKREVPIKGHIFKIYKPDETVKCSTGGLK